MNRLTLRVATSTLIVLALAGASVTLAADAPGLGDPGQLTKLTVSTGRTLPGTTESAPAVIVGRDLSQQLVVTAHYDSGQLRDYTGNVKYTASPDGVVSIDETGEVTPVANGTVTITVTCPEGRSATASITVRRIDNPPAVNFPNEVVPIFTKQGCNSGGCHGKSAGQNGFRLSLLGFEPQEDYEHLIKEARGRRVFPAAPERSLLLLKAAGILPHGGGRKLEEDSYGYKLIRRWIDQGMPYGKPGDPTLERIAVFPEQRIMAPDARQQLVVTAHYSDGSTRDVTRIVQYEANDPAMAEASITGLITVREQTGDVAVMVRYQANVGVFRATIPLGAPVDNLPVARNFIDELVFKKLTTLGLPPSEACDDPTFIRRITLDIAGRLPTPEETKAFLANPSGDKRDGWIETLLASTEYADYFANKWSAILRNKRRDERYMRGTYAFHAWIRDSLYANKPYDRFVREILTATGDIGQNPPVAWYRSVRKSEDQLQDTAQLFLGVRMHCARCHHHPFDKWSQNDYYGLAAFFSQVGRKQGAQPGEERIYHKRGLASAKNPRTKLDVRPAGLDVPPVELDPDRDPRQALVDWMAAKDNPFFARMLVNRYWKHFFGRGLVEPEDDLRLTNPPTNPELLDGLAAYFVESGYDLKGLVRVICQSRVYQLSSLPNEYNTSDTQSFARYYPKRLSAEVLLDAINQVSNSHTEFPGQPVGTRAVQLPDDSYTAGSYFLTVFGRPEMDSACECERTQAGSLAQCLHLLNSKEILAKLTDDNGRAATLAGDKSRDHEAKITELYTRAFSRDPEPGEVQVALQYIDKKRKRVSGKKEAGDPVREAYEDIVWAVLNSKEFLFNH